MEQGSPPSLVLFNSYQSQEFQPHNDDYEDDEALSLCDLATSKHEVPKANHPEEQFSDDLEQDFDFGGAGNSLPENKMCSADELFFRGQILPLQHSVTLPSELTTEGRSFIRSISFSGSEPTSVVSSRSSSTRSNNSGTSGSGSTSGSEVTKIRNQFHSHPSPRPQIRTRNVHHSNPKTSSKWSFLQLGMMKPQEIGLEDLKNRSQRSHGSSRSISMNTKDQNQNNKKKKTQLALFGGCKCSSNAIENTVYSRIPMVKPTGLKEEETKSRISKESNVGRSKRFFV
ncbi:hypothetical protein Lser_V15G12703 [Lactuca serriola]